MDRRLPSGSMISCNLTQRRRWLTFKVLVITPSKFKMEPENMSLEKEIPVGKQSVSAFMLKFWGVLGKNVQV